MNERIEQLADQCYNLPDIPEALYYRKFDKEKFAELIVGECAEVINKDIMYQVDSGVVSNVFGLNQARDLIKKHFGVEE